MLRKLPSFALAKNPLFRGFQLLSLSDVEPLVMFPQAPPTTKTTTKMASLLESTIGDYGREEWFFLHKTGIHLKYMTPGGESTLRVVPDIVGWRSDHLPPNFSMKLFHGGKGGNVFKSFVTLRPDWVFEVLSPSTEADDWGSKKEGYVSAGIPYYWIACPRRRRLVVFKNGEKIQDFVNPSGTITPEPFGMSLSLHKIWMNEMTIISTAIPGVDD